MTFDLVVCVACGRPPHEHSELKCLFGPSFFTARGHIGTIYPTQVLCLCCLMLMYDQETPPRVCLGCKARLIYEEETSCSVKP